VNALTPIIASTREDVARRREALPPAELERLAAARTEDRRPFLDALRAPGLSVIAEHKRRSPSAGVIREDLSLEEVVGAYERAGASALSVLTEEHSFAGSLEDLRAARAAASLPILRKDFIVDPYQVLEAAAFGADAVLLIVAALRRTQLAVLHAQALELGLDVLVEIHDARELGTALGAGATIVGINNRDLTTLEVDTRRTFELRPHLPDEVTVVAESGFSRPEQLAELHEAGVDAVLIGEALMRSADIEAALRTMSSWPRASSSAESRT
jgi:indole-3-glycerol phosphate synthase